MAPLCGNCCTGSISPRPLERRPLPPSPIFMFSHPHRHSILFLTAASMVLALASTVVAWVLVQLIGVITSIAFYHKISWGLVSPSHHQLGALVIFLPVIGGLIVGVMARYGSPAIRGHGIPEAMEQILLNRSRIPPKITILKPLSAAISIGTGGPFGAEGPIIATGGALGSLIGQIFSTTAGERKTLLAAGAAAGMTAIFGTPISAVLLAIELLLFEFNARSVVPVSLACATAAAARIWFFGHGAVFAMPAVGTQTPGVLFAFVVLGAVMGLAATAVSRAVYWVEERFEHLPIHWMWWPAIGAVAVGAIGYIAPRTMGVGYDNIEDIISNRLPLQIVAWLCGMKFISWAISLGSGTSGGTLAPLLTIGSGIGVLLAAGFNHLVPGLSIPLELAGVVGMAAMFAGASHALLASVVFAFETTWQPDTLPALLAGGTAAFLVSHMLARHSIMTEKIARRGVSVPNSYEPDPLLHVTVATVMETDIQTVPGDLKIEELARKIGSNDPRVSRRQASLVLDSDGALLGVITRGDVIRAVETAPEGSTVLDASSRRLIVVHPDETLHAALEKMLRHDIGRLPVVERNAPQKAIGYLGRAHLLAARSARIQEETVQEPGFWSRKEQEVLAGKGA